MKRIFEESGAGDVVVNSRILNVFKKKISVLQKAYRQASKAGGKSLAKLLNGWKTGPKYKFKIFYNEVEVQKVKTQCEILRGQKRTLEESVTEEAAKRIRLEERLQNVLKTAEKRDSYYKRRFKRLAKKVAAINFGKKTRGPAKKKIFWTIHTTTSDSREEAIKRRMSRNPFLSWFIRLCGN